MHDCDRGRRQRWRAPPQGRAQSPHVGPDGDCLQWVDWGDQSLSADLPHASSNKHTTIPRTSLPLREQDTHFLLQPNGNNIEIQLRHIQKSPQHACFQTLRKCNFFGIVWKVFRAAVLCYCFHYETSVTVWGTFIHFCHSCRNGVSDGNLKYLDVCRCQEVTLLIFLKFPRVQGCSCNFLWLKLGLRLQGKCRVKNLA